jgi:hypothetical protein
MERTERRQVSLSSLAISVWAALALVSACGGDGGSTPDAAAPSPDGPAAPDCGAPVIDDSIAAPTCTSKPVVPGVTDLSGTWVARVTAAQVVTAPIVGVMHNQYVLTMLVTLTQTGTEIVTDGRNCDRLQINEPNAAAPVVLPEKWAHTETPVHRTASFAVGAEGYPIFHLRADTEIVGAQLSSPAECLPTKSDDPAVYDQDKDDKPGITVVVKGQSLAGTICAVQSQTTAVNAIAVSANRLEGDLHFASQQNVLESDPDTLGQLYSLGTTTADPTLCNSGFVMVRIADAQAVDAGAGVDGGASVGCDWVRANAAALFAP